MVPDGFFKATLKTLTSKTRFVNTIIRIIAIRIKFLINELERPDREYYIHHTYR